MTSAHTLSVRDKAPVSARIGKAVIFVILLILLVAFILPFILVVFNAFKSMNDITANPMSAIGKDGFTLENFTNAMDKMQFWTVLGNSVIITTCATILTVLFSAMAAFVIARNPHWKASGILLGAMVASMVVPFQVLMVPIVSVYGGVFGILNSRITLILMHVGFSVSMATFMFHGSIRSNIPVELEEAANIDGCNRWKTFWLIVFPLLKPMIATVTVIDAMAFWNDYLLPSLILQKPNSLWTIPIATQQFYGTYSTDLGLVLAALLLAMLPILVLYLFLQRFIVEGVTSGAVKG